MQLNRAQKRQMIKHLNKPSTIKAIGERMEKAEQVHYKSKRNKYLAISILAIIGGIMLLYAL